MPGLTLAQVQTAIQKYGPVLRFHPSETYNMCSVEYFLQHSTLHDSQTGHDVVHPTVDQLPVGPSGDGRYWLNVDSSGIHGDLSTAKAYIHAFWDQTKTYTDLQFWFFYAYNGPGTAHINGLVMDTIAHTDNVGLAPLGAHFGDWECCILRIDNTTQHLIGAYLTQHSDGQYFNQNQLGSFQTVGDQIVVYASRNGHALYSSVSSNYTEHYKFPPSGIPIALEFFLRNDTADGGAHLDCAQNSTIVCADWLGVVPPNWVEYPYRWGPEGQGTAIAPGTVHRIMVAAFGDFSMFVPGSAIIEVAGDIAPHFNTDDLNGPSAPKTKDTWVSRFSTQQGLSSPPVTASVDANGDPDLVLLQVNVDGELNSPFPSTNYGGVSAICAIIAPQMWEFSLVDPADGSKGIVISEEGMYLTTAMVSVPYSNQSLTFSTNREDAAVMMPEAAEDGYFILRLISDNTVLTVNTMGMVMQFQPLQAADGDPHFQRFILPA
jgi:hypothetical protein